MLLISTAGEVVVFRNCDKLDLYGLKEDEEENQEKQRKKKNSEEDLEEVIPLKTGLTESVMA